MGFSVLVIENDKQWQGILTEHVDQVCKKLGVVCDIEIAQEYNEARSAIRKKRFDMLFLDLNLAESNTREGIQFLYLSRLDIHSPIFVVSVFEENDVKIPVECKTMVSRYINKSKLDPAEFQENIQGFVKSVKETMETKMEPITSTLATGILLEGVKFLFGELGRRLEFWREKKEKGQSPTNIEVIQNKQGNIALKLDDIQEEIQSIDSEGIKSLLKQLKTHKITLNTYEEELAKPNLEPRRRAEILVELPDIKDKIEEKGSILQSLIEKSLKK